jgi:polysaccharide deacetylase 2 family uncharacterized protein YibQ
MTRFRLLIVLCILIIGAAMIAFIGDDPEPVTMIAITQPVTVDPDRIGSLIESLPDEIDEGAPVAQWQRHATAVNLAPNQSAIAIVIDDLGNSTERLDHVLTLEVPLNLSFLSYASGLPAMVTRARQKGHEILVHLPMEPMDGEIDAGMNTLTSQMTSIELQQMIDWHLGRIDGYVGLNNHMGSKFTANSAGMAHVIDAAKDRGLIFLDSRTTNKTVGSDLARAAGVPTLQRDIFLDNDITKEAIVAQLIKAETIARSNGSAVVIGHPYPITINILQGWLQSLGDIQIVPMSALVIRNQRNAEMARN